jgi:hypothetical protein
LNIYPDPVIRRAEETSSKKQVVLGEQELDFIKDINLA